MVKKIMAAVMAGAMTLALAVPAFASSTPAPPSSHTNGTPTTAPVAISSSDNLIDADKSNTNHADLEFTFNTAAYIPVLDVQFTGAGAVVFNPYGLTYKWNDNTQNIVEYNTTNTADLGTATNQIISSVLTIENKSKAPVQIGATVSIKDSEVTYLKATKTATFSLASKSCATATTKQIFMFLAAANDPAKLVLKTGSSATGMTYASSNKSMLLVGTSAATSDKLWVLDKANPTKAGSEKVSLKFLGDMSQNPTNAWQATEVVTPTVSLSLKIVELNSTISADA